MELINTSRFKDKILSNLEKMDNNSKKDLLKIRKLFSNDKLYILGGFVRDSILKITNGYNSSINDLDILVDDISFKEKTSHFRGSFDKKKISRFGGMKLKYKDPFFSMDIFSMSNIFYLNQNPALDKNLENVLEGVDLTTSAFAYNLGKNEIYAHPFALRDIYDSKVDLLNDYSLIPSTLSRLITHSYKLKFQLGQKAVNYIKDNYKSELDNDIYNFLKYKEAEYFFQLVKSELSSIAK